MEILPRRLLPFFSFLAFINLCQLQDLPLGSNPVVPDCVRDCHDWYYDTTESPECYSRVWSCECDDRDFLDYLVCCMEEDCSGSDFEEGHEALSEFCTGSDEARDLFADLLVCKSNETETTSTTSNPTETTSGTSSATQSSESSSTGSVEPTAGGGPEEEEEETGSGGSGKPSQVALGAGLGVGIPIGLGVSGLIASFLLERNKARRKMLETSTADEASSTPGAKTSKTEPEGSGLVHELPSESTRVELPA